MSLLTRGAWIEIGYNYDEDNNIVSLLTRGAWIEILCPLKVNIFNKSLLTRGAWIEISMAKGNSNKSTVAPHTRSVD